MKCDDIKVKGDCEDEAKAAYECLNGLSCEEILSGAAKCQSKQDAFNSCQQGKGGNDDDDDDEGGNGGDDDDDDDEGGYGDNGGFGGDDDDDDDWGDDE